MLALWGSLIGVLAAGCFGIITYWYQQNLQRKADLQERKLGLYTTLGANIFKLLAAKPGPNRAELLSQIERCWLFASDGVLEGCYEFLAIYDQVDERDTRGMQECVRNDPTIRQKLEQALAKIFYEMRIDIKPETGKTIEWAQKNTKIYEWGVIALTSEESPTNS